MIDEVTTYTQDTRRVNTKIQKIKEQDARNNNNILFDNLANTQRCRAGRSQERMIKSHRANMFGLPKELWEMISVDNPTTYYKLLQVSKVFKLDTDTMKAKFIRKTEVDGIIYYRLPNSWPHSCNDQPAEIWANGDRFWYNNGKRHRCNDLPTTEQDSCHFRQWFINGKQHRDNDQPAEIYSSGTQYWYINGKLHRDNDQPAEIWANGTLCWYTNGKQHRDNDQPAEIYSSGTQYWYINGKLHRDNDQPAVIWAGGSLFWYINGKLHRDNDQPAKIHASGSQYWYSNGKLHRNNDQPAIILSSGAQRWFIDDKEYTPTVSP